jgi:peptidoglycan-associated lipoprotein
MKHNLGIKLAVLSMSLILGFSVSCQKKTVAVDTRSNPAAQQDRSGAAPADTSQIGEQTLDSSATGRGSESNVVLQEDIFFEFDKATLTPEAREALTKTGAWLRVNADVVITIEGHCDERGTTEYNLALGDRRAESVKTFLTDLGVERSRLTTVSYGEERPFVRGQGEVAWAQNRRAHFLIR